MWTDAFEPQTLRQRLYSRQAEQRALAQVSRDLSCDGNADVVLFWGGGRFRPGTKGAPSAPNKKIYRYLARYVPVVIVNEYRTSKLSVCCGEELKRPQCSKGIGFCSCGKIWKRDISAALRIAHNYYFTTNTGLEGEAASVQAAL